MELEQKDPQVFPFCLSLLFFSIELDSLSNSLLSLLSLSLTLIS